MNTLLLDRAQSSEHLAHPTSSYPATNGWALNLNRKFHNEKCFHMLPLKPLAHISVHPFEETLPPIQASEFGHRQALLMLCRWSIMPQSHSLHTQYRLATFVQASSLGKKHQKNKTVQSSFALLCSYQAAWRHLDASGITKPCALRARYAVLYRTAIGDGLFRDVLHEDPAQLAVCAPNSIPNFLFPGIAPKKIFAVHVLDRGLLTLRQTRETKVDHGGSGSDIVSLEAPSNSEDFRCPRYPCFGANDTQVGHLDHIRPGRKR